METEKLNIQPKAGILGVFSRLNYKPWYAIGEFVDNSTASYLGHKNILKFYKINELKIDIQYDAELKILKITDDAFGMEIDDFKRAVILDSNPDNLNGRNEFGMGLKTAASWFGNVWSVRSTQIDSENQYFAEVDINKLREQNLNSITIKKEKVSKFDHGTTIIIKNVTKSVAAPSTQKKIKDLLGSMYRRDINYDNVSIYFNGEKLKFNSYKILQYKNQEWKKNIDLKFTFDGKEYRVSGFVGIMEKGSYSKAGFALFRYNRVILGGLDQNYKPKAIFGQAQSQISLKLFGELDVEDFPVNQAKDGFIWDNGLEDAFVSALKRNILEYIEIAKLSIKERIGVEDISSEKSKKVEKDVKKSLKKIIFNDGIEENKIIDNIIDEKSENTIKKYALEIKDDNNVSEIKYSEPREYIINYNPVTKVKIFVRWELGRDENWINFNYDKSEILININHPIFKPYSRDEKFKVILDKIAVAFFAAERKTEKISEHKGYVQTGILESKFNSVLKKLFED